jgi:hypothetical protein
MNDFERVQSWVYKFAADLEKRKQNRQAKEDEVVAQLAAVRLAAEDGTLANPQEALRRLAHLEKMATSDQLSPMGTLEQVQKEIHSIYQGGSANTAHNFTQKGATRTSSELKDELEALTTFEYVPPEHKWDGEFADKHKSVQKIAFEQILYAFEDDGNWIDPSDQLDIDMPAPYTQNAPEPPDDEYPLGRHDWDD